MKLFFDISDILAYLRYARTVTGIQRAAINMITGLVHQHPDADIYLSFVHARDGVHKCVAASDATAALQDFDPIVLGKLFASDVRGATSKAGYLARFKTQPLKQILQSVKLHIAVQTGNRTWLRKRGINTNIAPGNPYGDDANIRAKTTALADCAEAGDMLICLGAMWDHADALASIGDLKARGIQTVFMIHDLIPVKRPETTYKTVAPKYAAMMAEIASYASALIGTSRSTTDDLTGYLAHLGVDLPVFSVALAQAGLKSADGSPAAAAMAECGAGGRGFAGAQLLALLPTLSDAAREASAVPYALCVGTVEPRKNLWRLVQAWRRIASDTSIDPVRLVLVGRRGWQSDGLIQMLEADTSGMISYVEAASDRDLDYLFAGCAFTISVSLYEGWGLPIGEGLSYGKTGVVSDISSHPEVGGDLVEYCDPLSVGSIETAARTLITNDQRRTALEAKIAAANLRRWEDVARDLWAALMAAKGKA